MSIFKHYESSSSASQAARRLENAMLESSGYAYRTHTMDGFIGAHIEKEYAWMLDPARDQGRVAGDRDPERVRLDAKREREREHPVVMDCGAHIGLFARYALEHGASKVVCYEPEPDNFELLRQNASVGLPSFVLGWQVELHHAALVEGDQTSIELYVNDGKNTGIHSTLPTKGRRTVTVAAMNFQAELDRIRPDIVKIDVEGSEHYLLKEAVMPASVMAMTVEFDTRQKVYDMSMREHIPFIVRHLEEQGFAKVNDPRLDTSTWSIVMKFAR